MTAINLNEAKTHFSRILSRVEAGEEIIIAKAGKPIARIVPFRKPMRKRPLGMDKGLFAVPVDFDAPLSDDQLGSIEGEISANSARPLR
jgi:prevent-host-death family protein